MSTITETLDRLEYETSDDAAAGFDEGFDAGVQHAVERIRAAMPEGSTTITLTIEEVGTLMAALVARQQGLLDAFSAEQHPDARKTLSASHTKAADLAVRLQREAVR